MGSENHFDNTCFDHNVCRNNSWLKNLEKKKMSKILIIIPIIVGSALSLTFIMDSTRLLEEKPFENTFKSQVETDFMNKIREAGDKTDPMLLL